MATKTKNGMFTKPDYTDAADIGVLNKNVDDLEAMYLSPYGSKTYQDSGYTDADPTRWAHSAGDLMLIETADFDNNANDPNETNYVGPSIVRMLKDVPAGTTLKYATTTKEINSGDYDVTPTSVLMELARLNKSVNTLNSSKTTTGFYANGTGPKNINEVAAILAGSISNNFILYFNYDSAFSKNSLESKNALLLGNWYHSQLFGSDGTQWIIESGILNKMNGFVGNRITSMDYNQSNAKLKVVIDNSAVRYITLTDS